MEYRYDSYCGLYCGACGIFLANMKNRVEDLAKEKGMKPEDLVCNGCKSAIQSVYCRDCEFIACAVEKKVEFCCDCPEYPCKKISDFKHDKSPHHSIVFKNLELIKEYGVENWLIEQKIRWSCPECGEPYSWYTEKCSNCGAKVLSSIDEEVELDD